MLSILSALVLQSSSPQIGTVDDVVVVGRRQQEQVEEFVAEVAAPIGGRGLARWRGSVCVGVVNLQRQAATAITDHVSRIAAEQGLRTGDPGCSPNIVIVFTDDAPALSAAMIMQHPRAFRPGYSGASQSRASLERFAADTRPVRWWHVGVPYVGQTGAVAVKMPGESPPFVPGEGLVNRGRPIADALLKTFIIVDVDQVGRYSGRQLGDYLALVALAQVDPDADVGSAQTILNLFKAPEQVAGLTAWDRSYLAALYDAYPERTDPEDQASAMFREIKRDEISQSAAE